MTEEAFSRPLFFIFLRMFSAGPYVLSVKLSGNILGCSNLQGFLMKVSCILEC